MKKIFLALLIASQAFAAPPTRLRDTVIRGSLAVGSTAVANSKAVLDVVSTTKGALPLPRMTQAQRDAIASPPTGLMVYNTDTAKPNQYNGAAWAALAGGSGASGNLLTNPDWNDSTQNWTASGGTYTRTTTAANIQPPSAGAGSWDSSSASQTLTSDAVTVTSGDGLSAANGAVAFFTKCASSTCTHKIQAYDGTNVLAEKTVTSSTSGFLLSSVNFIFPTSGTVAARVISVASDEPTIYLGRAFLGRAEDFNIAKITGATFYGSIKYASAASCQWTRAASTFLGFSADTDCATPTVRGQAAAPGTKIPGMTFASWPKGRYRISASGGFAKTSAQDESCYFRFSDGTNTSTQGEVYRSTESVIAPALTGIIDNPSALSNVTLQIQAASDSAATCAINNGATNGSLEIVVEYFPDFDQDAFTAEKLGWAVYGTSSGADISLGTAAVASPIEIVSSSLTMTAGSKSLPVEIPCSGTNPSTGTTCSAGSEGLGVVYTQPTEGLVHACFDFTHQIVIGSNGPDISTFFRIVETANTSQTALQTGIYIARHRAGESDTSGQRPSFGPTTRLCNLLYLTPGKKTLRINFTQSVTNTLTSSTILDNTFAFSVVPVNHAQPAPLIKNAVVSNSNGVERLERVKISCSGSASITSQSGTWVSSIGNISAGACAITMTSGIFSATPSCVTVASTTSGGDPIVFSLNVASATSMTADCSDLTGSDCGNFVADIICMGAR